MSSLNPFAKKKDDSSTPEAGKPAETKKEEKKDSQPSEDKDPNTKQTASTDEESKESIC